MMLELQQTWPLWFLAAVPFALLGFGGRRREPDRPGRAAERLLRVVAVLGLVLAMCDPIVWRAAGDVAVVHAIDVSRAVPVERVAAAVRAIRAAGAPAETVLFAERARVVASASELAAVLGPAGGEGEDRLGRGGTDLAGALETAAAALPWAACRHIVLASEGRHTRGDLWAAVERLREARIRVHTLASDLRAPLDAGIVQVSVPPRPPEGRPVTVEVLARATLPARGRLGVAVDDGPVAWSPVELPGGDSRWRLPVTFATAGVARLTVRVEAQGDLMPADDTGIVDVAVAPRQSVLQIVADPAVGRGLGTTLTRHGFEVTTRTAAVVARGGASLDRFDAVILHDPERDALPARIERDLERYVREGGGLVFVAGEHSHGRDAWSGSALERMLPVRFEGPRRRDRADLLLLIDRSYSMRGPRLEIAKTAVSTAIDALEDRHRAGVVAFDARPRELVPLEVKAEALARLGRVGGLTAAGQTNVFDALWDAYLRLRDSRAETRHVILLSDGNTAPTGRRAALPGDVQVADAPPDSFEALGEKLAAARISVSTVAIGDEPDVAFMHALARWTGGRAHVAARPEDVPALFADEARRLAGDALIERRFTPRVVYEADAIAGIDFSRSPPLLGQVVARVRPHADRMLDGVDGHPLLATHRHGLGVVTVFLSDASGRWSSEWRLWPGFGQFWAQTVRAATRDAPSDSPRLDLVREGDDLVAVLEQINTRTERAPVAIVVKPDGARVPIALDPAGPARLSGRLAGAARVAGSYRVELAAGAGSAAAPAATTAATTAVAALRVDPPALLPAGAEDRARLRAIVERSGGGFDVTPEQFAPACDDAPPKALPVWRLLCVAALLAYVVELGLRRTGGR